jgi:hypothetical protein
MGEMPLRGPCVHRLHEQVLMYVRVSLFCLPDDDDDELHLEIEAQHASLTDDDNDDDDDELQDDAANEVNGMNSAEVCKSAQNGLSERADRGKLERSCPTHMVNTTDPKATSLGSE